jgi:hypothetical protein
VGSVPNPFGCATSEADAETRPHGSRRQPQRPRRHCTSKTTFSIVPAKGNGARR